MEYSNFIQRYFEGELNNAEKEILFSELARNPELREEFEYEMKLITLAQQDFARIEPPTESTSYIFGSLGYKIPNSAGWNFSTTKLPFYSKFGKFVGKTIPYFAISLLTSATTMFLLWYFFYPFGTTSRAYFEIPKIQSSAELPNPSNSNNPTIVKQDLNYAHIEKIIQRSFEKALSNISAEKSSPSIASDHLIQQPENITQQNLVLFEANAKLTNNKTLLPSLVDKTNAQTNNLLPTFAFPRANSKNNYKTLNNFTLSIRGFSLKSDKVAKVNLEQSSFLNNAGIGIGYNIGKYSNLGIELGQEKFPQNFELNLYGELTYYRQNPLLWWYGVYYRQLIPSFFRSETINPFVQTFLGSTNVGPLIRGMAGLQYEPDHKVALFLGWEANVLYYNVQHKMYKTFKNGLTYGVNIRF